MIWPGSWSAGHHSGFALRTVRLGVRVAISIPCMEEARLQIPLALNTTCRAEAKYKGKMYELMEREGSKSLEVRGALCK